MAKTKKRVDEKQIPMLLPIGSKPVAEKSAATVAYRSKEFYEIRQKLVKSLTAKRQAI